jgi:hypothetical protein
VLRHLAATWAMQNGADLVAGHGMAVEMLLELPGGCGAGSHQFPARMTVKQNAANVMSAHKNY